MKTFKATIVGTAPLLQNNERKANPTDPATIALKRASTKRAKSEEDHENLKYLEFLAGLILDFDGKPAIPADWVLAILRAGAKANKLGKKVQAGVYFPDEEFFPLQYDGPKDPDGMYAQPDVFVDYRGVKNQGSTRVMRCRPKFPVGWRLTFAVPYDPDVIDGGQLETALELCGKVSGMGDYRPRFGRFVVESCSHG